MGPSALQAVVGGTIWFDRSRLPPKTLARLERRLTFPNPEYVSRVRFGRWTGATPEEITLMTETPDGILHLPRGAVGVLREVLATTGQSICFEDRRITRSMEPVRVKQKPQPSSPGVLFSSPRKTLLEQLSGLMRVRDDSSDTVFEQLIRREVVGKPAVSG